MSKLQQHIDLLRAECNKMLTQMENDDYTVNELLNAYKRVADLTNAITFLHSTLQLIEQNNRRIVTPPAGGLNGLRPSN